MTSPERVLAKICTSESHREHPAFPSHHFRRRGAEDRRNRRPDVGFEPCYSRSQSVRLHGQPHTRNDLCKSMQVLAGAGHALVENITILSYKKAPCHYVSESI